MTRAQYSVAVIGSGVKDEGRKATRASAATWAMISSSYSIWNIYFSDPVGRLILIYVVSSFYLHLITDNW